MKQSDVVLYLGCNVLRTTHMIQTVTDIFKMMGVSYAAVGGKTYCCGIQHYQRGDEEAARSVATTTAEPPLLPPGTSSGSWGLRVGPKQECSVEEPMANSSKLVLAAMEAPASSSRCTGVAV